MGEKKNTMHELHKPFIKLKNESGSEKVYYSLVYEELPEQFKLMAARELNETEERRKRGLEKLREFMEGKCKIVLEDYLLLSILRVCKYDFRKSEARLEKFLTKRREIVEKLAELGKEKIEYILDDCVMGMLPYRDKHGRCIMFTRPCGMKIEGRYDPDDIAVIFSASVLFLFKFPISTVAGFCYFGDCKSPSRYFLYRSFNSIKKFLFSVLAFPIRVSRVEVFNENSLLRSFQKFISPFVSKKLLSRVSLHGSSFDNLLKIYDSGILPEEFGGNIGPVSNTVYRQKLLDFIEDLKREII